MSVSVARAALCSPPSPEQVPEVKTRRCVAIVLAILCTAAFAYLLKTTSMMDYTFVSIPESAIGLLMLGSVFYAVRDTYLLCKASNSKTA